MGHNSIIYHEERISTCPACRKVNNRLAGLRRGIIPGDISICFSCNTPSIHNDDLSLRLLSADEYAALSAGLRDAIEQIQVQIKSKNGGER